MTDQSVVQNRRSRIDLNIKENLKYEEVVI